MRIVIVNCDASSRRKKRVGGVTEVDAMVVAGYSMEKRLGDRTVWKGGYRNGRRVLLGHRIMRARTTLEENDLSTVRKL